MHRIHAMCKFRPVETRQKVCPKIHSCPKCWALWYCTDAKLIKYIGLRIYASLLITASLRDSLRQNIQGCFKGVGEFLGCCTLYFWRVERVSCKIQGFVEGRESDLFNLFLQFHWQHKDIHPYENHESKWKFRMLISKIWYVFLEILETSKICLLQYVSHFIRYPSFITCEDICLRIESC